MYSYSRTFRHLMEPEASLPCSQSPPLVPHLSQINLVHTTPFCLSKIYLNIILPHTYNLPSGFFPSGSPRMVRTYQTVAQCAHSLNYYIILYQAIYSFQVSRAKNVPVRFSSHKRVLHVAPI
jgi:hypothetical protein